MRGTDFKRLASLDAMRGLTIAGMVLVNNPGSWKHVLPPLRHADWHGWTPADLVFPFFIFIVGVSLALSLSARREAPETRRTILGKILFRSGILFVLGLFLHLFPKFHTSGMRLPGVLQRIALCYLIASLIYLTSGKRTRLAVFLVLLAGYGLALKLVSVPGFGPGVLTPEGNLAGHIDRLLLSGHLYRPGFDPEGLLSTLPAVATALLGTLAGDLLRTDRTLVRKAAVCMGWGAALAVSGPLLHPLLPVNKQLWTSTFVLFAGGAALVLLGLLLVVVELFRFRFWAYPFFVLGTNAVAVYVLSTLATKTLLWIRVGSGGGGSSLYSWIYHNVFASWAGASAGSLVFALGYVLLWALLFIPLYRRRIFIKI